MLATLSMRTSLAANPLAMLPAAEITGALSEMADERLVAVCFASVSVIEPDESVGVTGVMLSEIFMFRLLTELSA